MNRVVCLAITALLALAAVPAAAQVPSSSPPAPQAPAAAPDVVMLKDGGLLRGTIAELKKDVSVTIVLLTGETRTISMSEVEYAGPTEAAPKKAPAADAPKTTPSAAREYGQQEQKDSRPYITVRAGEAPFSFRSPGSDITLHLHSGTATGHAVGYSARGGTSVHGIVADAYSPICTAPCEATLPVGTHRLALSRGKGSPVEPEGLVRLDGKSTVEGTYHSYAGYRTAGWITLGASLVIGGYLIFTGLMEPKTECWDVAGHQCRDTTDPNTGKILAGTAVWVAGGVVGWLLTTKSDEATISVTPATAASLGTARVAGASPAVRDSALPSGMVLRAIF